MTVAPTLGFTDQFTDKVGMLDSDMRIASHDEVGPDVFSVQVLVRGNRCAGKTRERGTTGRSGHTELCQSHTGLCQLIQVRCFEVVAAVKSKVALARVDGE